MGGGFGGALVLALVLRAVLFQAYYIRFTSMEPTLITETGFW